MSAYTTAVLADSPIGFWQQQETSGTNAADSSGNSNNGTYQTGTTLNDVHGGPTIDGVQVNSVFYNGTTGYILLPVMNTPNGYSIETFVKTDGTSPQAAAVLSSDTGGGVTSRVDHIMGFSDQNSWNGDNNATRDLNCGINVSGATTSGFFTLTDLTWYHAVASCETGTNKHFTLYINGAQQAQQLITIASFTSDSIASKIGWSGGGGGQLLSSFFSGWLSMTSLYNYALTASQVTTHYNASIGSTSPIVMII